MAEPFDLEKRRIESIRRGAIPKMTARWIVALVLLAGVGLATVAGCGKQNASVSVSEAERLVEAWIAAHHNQEKWNPRPALAEITTPDVLSDLDAQAFRVKGNTGNIWEPGAYLIKDRAAYPMGTAVGGAGLTQLTTYDADRDGRKELFYVYSWGSGSHYSVIGCYSFDGPTPVIATGAEIEGADMQLVLDKDGALSARVARVLYAPARRGSSSKLSLSPGFEIGRVQLKKRGDGDRSVTIDKNTQLPSEWRSRMRVSTVENTWRVILEPPQNSIFEPGGPEYSNVQTLSKPPVWSRDGLKVRLDSIGRSTGGFFNEDCFRMNLSWSGVPKSFDLDYDSLKTINGSGRDLGGAMYSGGGDSATFAIATHGGSFSSLQEITGSFDNSYDTQRVYGPFAIGRADNRIIAKDKQAAYSYLDWQLMDLPYEMIEGSYFRMSGPSLVKKAPDKHHRYLVLRYYVTQRDEEVGWPRVMVYGSDRKWHESFYLLNQIRWLDSNFESGAAYTGLSVDLNSGAGAEVSSVSGPAAAGIQAGDLITRIDGKRIADFRSVLFSPDRRVGKPMSVTVLRGRKEVELQITPVQHPVWQGMSAQAGEVAAAKLAPLVGARKDWEILAMAFVLPDPVPLSFKPLKVKFIRNEKVPPTKRIPFVFRNVKIPPDFWTAELKPTGN